MDSISYKAVDHLCIYRALSLLVSVTHCMQSDGKCSAYTPCFGVACTCKFTRIQVKQREGHEI